MSTGALETYPRLVGDIGGTNARFGIIAAPGRAPEHVAVLACADSPGPREAIERYLDTMRLPRPRWGAIGIANPVDSDVVRMTNHAWGFSITTVREQLGLERLLVINDFTALALAVPALRPAELRQIGPGNPVTGKAIALIGSGTGLGISGLVPCVRGYAPIEGEGGHITLAASDRFEARVIEYLSQRFSHVSAERVLSGPGLTALYEATAHLDGEPVESGLAPQEITRRAIAQECELCVRTVTTFCAMLGTVAANLALALGAQGGVYIGGGIVPRLGTFFEQSPFRTRFEQKGRFSNYLAHIPTYVIHATYPALIGAARALDSELQAGFDSRRRA